MNEQANTSELTREELIERINDCRIRILEQLGIEVPEILKAGASNAAS